MVQSTDSVAIEVLDKVLKQHPLLLKAADDIRTKTAGVLKKGSLFCVEQAVVLQHQLNIKSFEATTGVNPTLIASLVAWAATKSIYRFDPFLYDELINTDLLNAVPTEAFRHLPSEALFIETQPSDLLHFPLKGFWMFLSLLEGDEHLVIVAVVDFPEIATDTTGYAHYHFKVPLGRTTINEVLELTYGNDLDALADPHLFHLKLLFSQVLSLGLYLCAEEPDIENWKPSRSTHKYIGKKKRLAIRKEPERWEVGARIGSALKMAHEQRLEVMLNERNSEGEGEGSAVRPHIRRAHWHSYWVGKRGEQTLSVRWLPPIPVNVTDPNELPAVIRPVVEG